MLLPAGNKGLVDMWLYKWRMLQWFLSTAVADVSKNPAEQTVLKENLSSVAAHNKAFGQVRDVLTVCHRCFDSLPLIYQLDLLNLRAHQLLN